MLSPMIGNLSVSNLKNDKYPVHCGYCSGFDLSVENFAGFVEYSFGFDGIPVCVVFPCCANRTYYLSFDCYFYRSIADMFCYRTDDSADLFESESAIAFDFDLDSVYGFEYLFEFVFWYLFGFESDFCYQTVFLLCLHFARGYLLHFCFDPAIDRCVFPASCHYRCVCKRYHFYRYKHHFGWWSKPLPDGYLSG